MATHNMPWPTNIGKGNTNKMFKSFSSKLYRFIQKNADFTILFLLVQVFFQKIPVYVKWTQKLNLKLSFDTESSKKNNIFGYACVFIHKKEIRFNLYWV